MKCEQVLHLDVTNVNTYQYVYAKQGDKNSRVLKVLLFNQGTRVLPAVTDQITLRCIKPDQKSCMITGSVDDTGIISVELTDQCLAVPGSVRADIAVQRGESVISSVTFFIQVSPMPLNANQAPSTNEFLTLMEMIEAAKSATDSATKAAQSANSASSAATEAVSKAEQAQKAAQSVRDDADAGKFNGAQGEKGDPGKDAVIDTTLSHAGEAADAAAVGRRLTVVEQQVANTNIDNVDLRNIILDIKAGTAPTKYPVGSQINIDWDRVDGSGNKTAYHPDLNIVHYDTATLKDDDNEQEYTANVMYLEWDKTIPDSIAFCVQQALQCFDGTDGAPDGLPAGTYIIKMKAPNGGQTFRNKWHGKYVTFALTKAIPSGGTLRLTVSNWNGTTDTSIALHFCTYAAANQDDELLEEVVVSVSSDAQPTDGTYLGEVWGDNVGYGKLNHPEACYYGDNTWSNSDLRQWLNSAGTNWWQKLTRYNIRPNIANTRQGFLTSMDADLSSYIKPVKHVTIGNNCKFPDEKFITYDKIFLHSNTQSNITTNDSAQFDNEGARWDYYKALASGVSNLSTQGMFKIWNTYPILIRYAINAPTTAQYVFGRSAYLGSANSVCSVYVSGGCAHSYASSGIRCLPACVIGANRAT